MRLLAGGCSIIPVYVRAEWTDLGKAEAKRPHREALIETGFFEWKFSEKRGRDVQVAQWIRFQSERADEALLREWIKLGVLGLGLVTGEISNLVAIDIDEDGKSLLASLGWEAHTITPSGGAHVFVRHPGWRVRTAKSNVGEVKWRSDLTLPRGVDVRGDGGHVVAAPTITEKGAYVRTANKKFLSRFDIPEEVTHLGEVSRFRSALTLDQDPEVLRVQLEMEDRESRAASLAKLRSHAGRVLSPEDFESGTGAFDGRDASLVAVLERAI